MFYVSEYISVYISAVHLELKRKIFRFIVDFGCESVFVKEENVFYLLCEIVK